jgi:MFS family permease
MVKHTNSIPPKLVKLRIVILSFILFFNTISTTYLYSFLPEMMINLGMVKSISESGGYAAWMASGFFVGRFISASFWGFFIDTYGRKPGLLLVLCSVSISCLFFGFAKNFYYALAIRFATGLFNGLSIIGKTLSTEICPSEFKSWSISVTNTIWALGGTVGPAIGAYFYKSIPDMPYLASSIATAVIGLTLAFLSWKYFEETLVIEGESIPKPIPQDLQSAISLDPIKNSSSSSQALDNTQDNPGTAFKSLSTFQQILYIINIPNICKLMFIFSINTFYAAVLGELIPFWVAAKYEDGGLGFNYKDISQVYLYLTAPQLILQIVLYPYIQNMKGDFWLLLIGHFVHLPMFFCLPFCHGFGQGAFASQKGWIIFWIFIRNFASFMNFAALQRLTNDAIYADKRGKLNGIQLTFSSCLQVLAPVLGGWLLSWTMKSTRIFPIDYHLVFYILTLITTGAIFVIYRLSFHDMKRMKLRGENDIYFG